jgi:3-(3-hydroxy-phenyl)propionate hydroxylase
VSAPVVVVGAGPVGMTAALLLARRGIECVLLERHPAPYPLPRAVHLDGEVVRILQHIGLAEEFRAISRPMPGLRLVDARLRTIAEFRRDNLTGGYGHPEASMFDQPDLERLLIAAVDREPRITLHRGAEVTGVAPRAGGALLRYRHRGSLRDLAAAAVLGCDGAGSTVRTLLGIPLRDLGFTEPWLVVDVRARRPLPMWEGVHQVCDPRRAATFMHLVRDRYRFEFRIRAGERVADLGTPEGVARLLAPWTGGTGLHRLELLRAASYTFRARVARRWRRGRVFLLGDAAHQTPPFIGQGLGAGLRDAYNLVWKLDLVLRGRAAESLLDTYQAERAPHAVTQIRSAILVGWALTGGGGRTAALRRALVRGGCRIPAVSRAALRASSPPLRVGPGRRRSPVGRPLPQEHRDGWSDDRLGDGFALVTLDPATPAPAGLPVVAVDPAGAVGGWLAAARVRSVLVRPDRVVCAARRAPRSPRGAGPR